MCYFHCWARASKRKHVYANVPSCARKKSSNTGSQRVPRTNLCNNLWNSTSCCFMQFCKMLNPYAVRVVGGRL